MTYQSHIPASLHGLDQERFAQLSRHLGDVYRQEMAEQQVASASMGLFDRFYLPLAAALARAADGRQTPLIVGVNGAQGSGKSTICRLLQKLLTTGFDLQVATFSIDDLYLTREERLALSRNVHPLLATRGVPGTHDVALGLHLLDGLEDRTPGRIVTIPTFDKARDDRAPRSCWRSVTTPVDLVLFEGWCVGARPQPAAALARAVNDLERREDAQGAWRRYVNQRLQHDYSQLFARIDLLIMLEIPDMACVHAWRGLQEQRLAALKKPEEQGFVMDDAALKRFIMHYERLTQHMLEEMPWRADLVLRLGDDHQIAGFRCNMSPDIKIDNRA